MKFVSSVKLQIVPLVHMLVTAVLVSKGIFFNKVHASLVSKIAKSAPVINLAVNAFREPISLNHCAILACQCVKPVQTAFPVPSARMDCI